MSSQLNVDAIVDKAGSGGTNVKIGNTSTYVSDGGNVTQNTVQGLLKSWCNFEQSSSHTIRDSFNISGLTDDGFGLTDLSYTSNFNNTSYVAGCHSGRQAVDSASAYFLFPLNDGSPGNSDYTTSRTATSGGYSSGTSSVLDQFDLYLALISVAGDLA